MTIEQFVKKAIEGQEGNLPKHTVVRANRYWVELLDANGTPYTQSLDTWLLDPEAWKAVGKVEGWEEQGGFLYPNLNGTRWQHEMHRMVDALAEGKTIEQFLSELT